MAAPSGPVCGSCCDESEGEGRERVGDQAGHEGRVLDVSLAAPSFARARSAGPSCFIGACAAGDRYAEFAAALVAVGLLTVVAVVAAGRPPGWRLPAWTAAVSVVAIDVTWAAVPPPDAEAFPIGAAIAGWGHAVVVPRTGHRPGGRDGQRAGPDDRGTSVEGPLIVRVW